MIKSYKGGKSKAIRGLKAYADKAFQAAGKELVYMEVIEKDEDGLWGFDTDKVDALLEDKVAPPIVDVPAPAPKKATSKRQERECQNGVYKPKAGKCRTVWDWCDLKCDTDYETHVNSEGIPTVADVRDKATAEGWNTTNAVIEYYNWRKFNGITGRAKKA